MINYIDYIIEWLLQDRLLAQQVVYSANEKDWTGKKLVIIPSDFFDDGVFLTPKSLPQESNTFIKTRGLIDGIEDDVYPKILYGSNKITNNGKQTIIEADVVASTFFLVTRYEELLNPKRDQHGRFPANESYLFKNGYIWQPIVDQYGNYLRQLLNAPLLTHTIRTINLTHDVDTIEFYRHLRGFAGGIKRGQIKQTLQAQKQLTSDPAYTFPWLIEQDKQIKKAKQIYFIKAAQENKGHDYPVYNLMGQDAQQLIFLLNSNNIEIGLHCSYASAENNNLIIQEKNKLQQAINKQVRKSRFHYLRTCQPDDLQTLADIGITDDYTMGFAQMAGFRLGTCRPINWINPKTRQVTPLVLHPLTAMDCSLSDYMKLDADDSFNYVRDLIDQIAYQNGELNLLWHNSVINDTNYHKQLYQRIIAYLKTK
ncbi:MAG: polysaccharide deacetylase family protein [Paludibacteraceae bacterium]|nr:polysaccharide deacetylase family protein [Paludibacteraceae bacterium]